MMTFLEMKSVFVHFLFVLKASGITLGLTSVQTFPLVNISPVSGPEWPSLLLIIQQSVPRPAPVARTQVSTQRFLANCLSVGLLGFAAELRSPEWS